MTQEVKVPKVIDKPDIIKLITWYVKDGDEVTEQAALCLLETSKASFEVPADVKGFFKRTKKEGDTVQVGDVVGLIADSLQELGLA